MWLLQKQYHEQYFCEYKKENEKGAKERQREKCKDILYI